MPLRAPSGAADRQEKVPLPSPVETRYVATLTLSQHMCTLGSSTQKQIHALRSGCASTALTSSMARNNGRVWRMCLGGLNIEEALRHVAAVEHIPQLRLSS